MKPLLQKHASKLRFGFIGGINTALDFGILFILVALGLDKIPSNYISTSISFIFSFFANRSYTFKSKGAAKKQFIPFLVVTLFGLWVLQPIVIWVSGLFLGSYFSAEITLVISKLLATVVSLMWNYILYSRVVFKEK